MKRITFILSGLILLLSNCKKEPNKLPEFEPPDGSFNLIYEKILTPSCALSGCHDGNPGFSHPKLTGVNTYKEIVTDHVHNANAERLQLSLVKPFEVDASFFYQKLIFEQSDFAFGASMPAGGLTLTDGQIEFIRQWIAAGAPESGHVADRNLIE